MIASVSQKLTDLVSQKLADLGGATNEYTWSTARLGLGEIFVLCFEFFTAPLSMEHDNLIIFEEFSRQNILEMHLLRQNFLQTWS